MAFASVLLIASVIIFARILQVSWIPIGTFFAAHYRIVKLIYRYFDLPWTSLSSAGNPIRAPLVPVYDGNGESVILRSYYKLIRGQEISFSISSKNQKKILRLIRLIRNLEQDLQNQLMASRNSVPPITQTIMMFSFIFVIRKVNTTVTMRLKMDNLL